LGIEPVQLVRLWGEVDVIAMFDRDIAIDPYGNHTGEARVMDVDECVGAQMLGHADAPLPQTLDGADGGMFGADPDGGGTLFFGLDAPRV